MEVAEGSPHGGLAHLDNGENRRVYMSKEKLFQSTKHLGARDMGEEPVPIQKQGNQERERESRSPGT